MSSNADTRQHVRRYANGAPPSGSNNTLLYGLLGTAVVGGGGYYYLNSASSPANQHGATNESGAHGQPASKEEAKNIPAKAGTPGSENAAIKCFKGGDQGFISLVLDAVEPVSHNTKKFRFKLDSEDAVSGLPVASALLTKYKGPEMEKAVIRPYTPTSDEGKDYTNYTLTSNADRNFARQQGLYRLDCKEIPQRTHVRASSQHEPWSTSGL